MVSRLNLGPCWCGGSWAWIIRHWPWSGMFRLPAAGSMIAALVSAKSVGPVSRQTRWMLTGAWADGAGAVLDRIGIIGFRTNLLAPACWRSGLGSSGWANFCGFWEPPSGRPFFEPLRRPSRKIGPAGYLAAHFGHFLMLLAADVSAWQVGLMTAFGTFQPLLVLGVLACRFGIVACLHVFWPTAAPDNLIHRHPDLPPRSSLICRRLMVPKTTSTTFHKTIFTPVALRVICCNPRGLETMPGDILKPPCKLAYMGPSSHAQKKRVASRHLCQNAQPSREKDRDDIHRPQRPCSSRPHVPSGESALALARRLVKR